jgi:hypothetical protein
VEVVQPKAKKAEQIHLMSQAIKDSQVNDFGSHYSRDQLRRTSKGSFPGLPNDAAAEEVQ